MMAKVQKSPGENAESNNKKPSSLLASSLAAIIVALLTSAFNYVIWMNQWQKQLDEKLFDSRYELLKDTALLCTKYQLARERAIVYMVMWTGMTQEVPKTEIERLSRIGKKLDALLPEEYSGYVESSKLFPEIKSQIEVVKTLFGSKTNGALNNYVKVVSKKPEEYIDEYMKQTKSHQRDKLGREYVTAEMKVFARQAEEEMNVALAEVLTAMREELGMRGSTHN
jgi:hypothetical protein